MILLAKKKKNEVIGFAARTTGSFNLNMNTQIYGLFPFKIGKIDLIRHVASPSIGYSYGPDFSKEILGSNPNTTRSLSRMMVKSFFLGPICWNPSWWYPARRKSVAKFFIK
ncbi:MAG: hypothetical protein Ct9H90mP20_4970 [Candidatus Neomarinimicrobiota bacterium]|nr:MAG: hypothetical protein Ct9H90mP20_4970 [Candidatus Neomarinimicrobiota bacterium]